MQPSDPQPADRDRSVGGLGESLGEYLREQRRAAQLSLRQLAERAEVSNPYLSQVERGLRQPSAQVLNQIARGLRISTHALYVRAGLLADEIRPEEPRGKSAAAEDSSGERAYGERASGAASTAPFPAVPMAVRNDPHLLDRHKLLLLDLYDTFRRDAAADRHSKADLHRNAQLHPSVSARSTP